MTKNPEFAECACEIARAQASIRFANEEVIVLSLRLGRLMTRFNRQDLSRFISWISLYSNIKDASMKADDELSPLVKSGQVNSNPVLQSQLSFCLSQKSRLCSKIEVMNDVLNGIVEDILENGPIEDLQKDELKAALEGIYQESKRKMDPQPIPT